MYNINLDPDPNWAKILDPDLDQNSMYLDPQDWKIEYISKIKYFLEYRFGLVETISITLK